MELSKIIGDAIRKQDVAGFAILHNALSHANAAARDIHVGIDIGDTIDRATVHAHPHHDIGPVPQRPANVDRASDRSFRIAKEDQSHSVARRQANKILACPAIFRSVENNLLKLA